MIIDTLLTLIVGYIAFGIKACTQGIITFESANTDGTSVAFPATSQPVVAAFWESTTTDLDNSDAVIFYRWIYKYYIIN